MCTGADGAPVLSRELQRSGQSLPASQGARHRSGVSALTGRGTYADFALFQDYFPVMETINGQVLAACNREAEALSTRWRKVPLGGSDSHTMAELGRAFTEAPGARKIEFLSELKAGRVRDRKRWAHSTTGCEQNFLSPCTAPLGQNPGRLPHPTARFLCRSGTAQPHSRS